MGLIVLFCFIQVLLVIPDALYIWECVFVKLENLCYYPVYYVIFKTRRSDQYSTLPDIRMSDVARDVDGDSGIDSTASSNSDNISNDSSQSDSSDLMVASVLENDSGMRAIVEQITPDSDRVNTFDRRLTNAMQTGMLYISMLPMTLHLVRAYVASHRPRRSTLFHLLNILFHVVIFCALLGVSVALLRQLRFNSKPPQFFDPRSNIQKMLDLAGNVTDSSALNCYNCSAWNSNTPCE